MRCVVLDDYQDVAKAYADWSAVDGEVESLTEHVADEAALADRVAGAEVLVAMRERTRFTPSLFDRLPDLRLAAPADEIPFKPGDTIQGMLELPVTW